MLYGKSLRIAKLYIPSTMKAQINIEILLFVGQIGPSGKWYVIPIFEGRFFIFFMGKNKKKIIFSLHCGVRTKKLI